MIWLLALPFYCIANVPTIQNVTVEAATDTIGANLVPNFSFEESPVTTAGRLLTAIRTTAKSLPALASSSP